jgi:hypothetical protein
VYEVFGSGGLNRNEEDGYIQIRHAQVIDGLAYKLSVLRNWGYFLTPWFNRPWLSIQDHVTSHEVYDQSKTFDQRQLDRAEQDEAALSLLPPEVKALFDAPDH